MATNRSRLLLAFLIALVAAGCSTLSQTPSAPPSSEDSLAKAANANRDGNAAASTKGGQDEQAVQGEEGCDLSPEAQAERRHQILMDEALEFCQAAQEFWQKGDLDNALEALDQAYSLALQADGEDNPKLAQQKEDLRFLIAKRIMEIYASRNIVVNGHHNAIPLVRNAHVEAEIASLTGVERDFFVASLQRSGRYRDQIVNALRQAGLPEELSWLPLIESGFKVNALSPARALGLWQFIASTGYKFGLKRDVYIDERLDPEKSTAAAIGYLKELHGMFGDWTTVLAAYNCGEGRVLRTIRTQNVNYLDNFWDLYERLPQETARYVPRFLATLHILKDLKAYGLDQIAFDAPFSYEIATVTRRVHLRDVAAAIGTTEEDLHQLNPELRYRIAPEEDYPLKVPDGTAETLLAVIDQIPTSFPSSSVACSSSDAAGSPALAKVSSSIRQPARKESVKHRVRKGETLSSIARRYGTSVSSLMAANNMKRGNHILAGNVLNVPGKGQPPVEKDSGRRVVAGKATPGVRHVVSSGDSLWNLARRYNTTVPKILAANNMASQSLTIGQSLNIPSSGAQPAAAETKLKVYNVRKGDTPFMIAERFNMPLESLLRVNRLTPRCTIYPGQSLQVE